MKSLFSLATTIFLLSKAEASTFYRGGAELLNPEAYSIHLAGSIFQTTGQFDSEGISSELALGNSYRLMDLNLALGYGISRNLEVTGLARARKVSSIVNDIESTRFGGESLGFEGKYAFAPIGKALYAVGVHYRKTLYSNATYGGGVSIPSGEIVLGDAGNEYGADLYFTYADRPFKWDFKLGVNSPGNELSEEVVYKAEGMYRFASLGLFAGVEGIYSLKTDQYDNDAQSKPPQATGASMLFNSINRQKTAPYLGMSYAFEKLLIAVKGQKVISGISTDRGDSIELALNWSTEGISHESLKIGSFKEYQIEAAVLKVSGEGNFVRIDQGVSTDVEKGMKFDIYQTDYFGGNILVAAGIVYEAGADWSVIKLVKKYQKIEIKPGFAARGGH